MGGVYTFEDVDVLGGKYFVDVSNMDSDTDTQLTLQRMFLLVYKPIYDTFREVNLATGSTSATWRVYFLTSSCPSSLIVNGRVCDQVLSDNKLHPAHGEMPRSSRIVCRSAVALTTDYTWVRQLATSLYGAEVYPATLPKPEETSTDICARCDCLCRCNS